MSRYRFIAAEKDNHPVRIMCHVLEVSPSGYYAWRGRQVCERARANADLAQRISRIHQGSRGTYGAPRVRAALASEGVHVGRKRVARLMHEQGLWGVRRPRRRVRTTVVEPGAPVAPNLVQRNFEPGAINCLWVADISVP